MTGREAHDHRVYKDRLTTTGCTSNQEVWHLRKVPNVRLTLDVFAQDDWQIERSLR